MHDLQFYVLSSFLLLYRYHVHCIFESTDSSVGVVTVRRNRRQESFDSWQGPGIFLFSEASTPTLGPTQPHKYWFAGASFPANQEVLRVLRDPKLVTLCTISCQLFRFLARSFQSTTSRPISFKVHFNIVLSSTPLSSKWSFLLRVSPP